MHDAELLSAWNSFYVMIGSSAAALTGLTFVVMSLINNQRYSQAGVSTFTTPTVVHFSCALFAAALMSAPFRSLAPIALLLGILGAYGAFYVARTGLRTSKLENYRPDLEDWTWHVFLPLVAYATIFTGALALRADAAQALYAPAAAVTLLIFIGIHNAWDVVTFIATGQIDVLPDSPAEAGAAQEVRAAPTEPGPSAPKT